MGETRVFAIGPDSTLEPVPAREELVDGEKRVYITKEDSDAAQSRARVKSGRFGTPKRLRASELAAPSDRVGR